MIVPTKNLRYTVHLHHKYTSYEQLLRGQVGRDGLQAVNPKVVSLYYDMKRNGMVNPILVYATNESDIYSIAVGNQRLSVARALGWKELRCITVIDRDDIPIQMRQHYVNLVWHDGQQKYVKQ